MTDSRKSLEELENDVWGDPKFESHVVTECYRIRRAPLGELTNEDLRLAIGQGMGLPHLLPVAIERLRRDPLASGNFFEGDLFLSLLRVPDLAWKENPSLRDELMGIADLFFRAAASLNDTWRANCAPDIHSAYARFRAGSMA